MPACSLTRFCATLSPHHYCPGLLCLIKTCSVARYSVAFLLFILLCQMFGLHLLFCLHAPAEGASFQLGQEDQCPACSLTPHTAAALFSTDLNLTSRGVEKHFSYFTEQMSGIIPLHLLPTKISQSFQEGLGFLFFVPTVSNWSPDPLLESN